MVATAHFKFYLNTVNDLGLISLSNGCQISLRQNVGEDYNIYNKTNKTAANASMTIDNRTQCRVSHEKNLRRVVKRAHTQREQIGGSEGVS